MYILQFHIIKTERKMKKDNKPVEKNICFINLHQAYFTTQKAQEK